LLEGDIDQAVAQRLVDELLVDPVVETGRLSGVAARPNGSGEGATSLTVLLKPGVMDPVAQSITEASRGLDSPLPGVRFYRRYYAGAALPPATRDVLRKILANDAIEQLVEGPLTLDHVTVGRPYAFRRVVVPLRDADDQALLRISKEGQLALRL